MPTCGCCCGKRDQELRSRCGCGESRDAPRVQGIRISDRGKCECGTASRSFSNFVYGRSSQAVRTKGINCCCKRIEAFLSATCCCRDRRFTSTWHDRWRDLP